MQQKFSVKNVKCGGCTTAIKQALITLPGVTEVIVEVSTGSVVVAGDNLDVTELTNKLQEAGYPVN